MRAFRRAVTVEIFHGIETVGNTGGVKITHAATADVTTKGRLIPAGENGEVLIGGLSMVADMRLSVDDDVDIRPLASSQYDEYARDRVIINSQKYLVVRAAKIESFGGVIHAALITEHE